MERSLPVSIILTIVTCGIYGIYWFVVITDEVNRLSETEDTGGGVAFLLTFITCGLYGIYWAYNMGKKTTKLSQMRGENDKDNGILYLILEVIGLNIIVCVLVQNEINNTLVARGAITQDV